MFDMNFRMNLASGKYTRWATNLTEHQVFVLLWILGEYGYRGRKLEGFLDKHDENLLFLDDRGRKSLEPNFGYIRLRTALTAIHEIVTFGLMNKEIEINSFQAWSDKVEKAICEAEQLKK